MNLQYLSVSTAILFLLSLIPTYAPTTQGETGQQSILMIVNDIPLPPVAPPPIPTPKLKTNVQTTPTKRPVVSNPVRANSNTHKFDIDKLARAVAIAETSGCTKGYGVTHNNCHGVKSGNTYPCPGTPKGKMCKFATKDESFIAFKTIWQKWYKTYPTKRLASIWTGADSADTWLRHVNISYNQ